MRRVQTVAGATKSDNSKSRILFTMLGTPEAVEAVALGDGGFIGALAPGSIWVDCSTIHPAASRKNASVAGSKGIHFVDAPVLGPIRRFLPDLGAIPRQVLLRRIGKISQ